MVYIKHMAQAAQEENPDIPIALHLDHGNSLETCMQAIELGFTSVMIDGSLKEDSKAPTTFEENLEVTASVVEYAHKFGVTVEGELGTLGGIEDGVGSGQGQTNRSRRGSEIYRAERSRCTGPGHGAPARGAYKFKAKPKLALDIISAISDKLPYFPLVMHGSSSVPSELIDIINSYGGKLESTMGVPIPSIQEAIKRGVRKINVDTDGRLAMTGAVRRVLTEGIRPCF
ncbi:MAG: class II fructose-bisphosphate aldolase [Actinomycetota bacterium]|nr:class II fructose-bisphosphate aldolase [Actinomycetota bacterium]